jgi:hypothetical protein
MTERKHFKRRVRERARKTGESYTAARRQLRRTEEMMTMEPTTALTLMCSFCHKSNDHIEKLVAGPGVFICDECIALAASIVEAERATARAAHEQPVPLDDRSVDDLLPIFGALAHADDARTHATRRWADALAARGVTDGQMAEAAGITIGQLHDQLARD